MREELGDAAEEMQSLLKAIEQSLRETKRRPCNFSLFPARQESSASLHSRASRAPEGNGSGMENSPAPKDSLRSRVSQVANDA